MRAAHLCAKKAITTEAIVFFETNILIYMHKKPSRDQ